jgi:hypothetical protein
MVVTASAPSVQVESGLFVHAAGVAGRGSVEGGVGGAGAVVGVVV